VSHPLLRQGLVTFNAEITRLNAQLASQRGEWDRAKAELVEAQAQLAARGAEVHQLNIRIDYQQREWEVAKAEVTRLDAHIASRQGEWEEAKAEVTRLNAHIASRQGEWERVKAELVQTQLRLSAVEAHITAFLSTTSWRFTAPLRAIATRTRGILDLSARAKMNLKVRLKPQMVRTGAYLAARPGLKGKVLLALRRFPRVHARLARAARPVSTMSNTRAASEQVASLDADHLTPSARRVYQDLLDARSPASLRSGESS
jgi:cell division protein FtsL